MNGEAKFKVLLATCMESDNWISIHTYNRQILAGLQCRTDELSVSTIHPFGGNISSATVRAFVRRFIYPLHVRAAVAGAGKSTILHVTDQFYAYLLPSDCPGIVTCHDIAEYRCSDMTAAQLSRWKKRIEHLKFASLIFADSHATATDLREMLGIGEDRIMVNHMGVDEDFGRLSADHSFSPEVSRLVGLAEHGVLALHVGVNLTRKNISLMLEAIALVRNAGIPVHLVKVGDVLCRDAVGCERAFTVENRNGRYSGLVDQLGIRDCIIDMGRVDRTTLIELYNVCNVFLFPSLHEGFGFPILEAQACGCPCVLANTSCLPEIGGDAALFHDPKNARAMADCMVNLAKDRALRDNLALKGLQNVRKFTWEAHVERLVKGYRRVLGS